MKLKSLLDNNSDFLWYILYLLSSLLALSSLLVCQSKKYFSDYSMQPSSVYELTALLGYIAIAALVLAAYKLARQSLATLCGANAIIFVLLVSIYLSDKLLDKFTPPWPAISLHGVDPKIGPNAWGRIQSMNKDAQKNNSWGQRDIERKVGKEIGKKRVAFIGDSFLEESSITPLSLLVERLLNNHIEVINLGVSTTGPIRYKGVFREVAQKLDLDATYLFFFLGNDFHENPDIRHPVLKSLASPKPKASVLGQLTPNLNYFLSKRYNFVANAWLENNLHQSEQKQLEKFRADGREKLVSNILNFVPDPIKTECAQLLSAQPLDNFFKQLSNPDAGLFRTYVFNIACQNLQWQQPRHSPNKSNFLRVAKIVEEIYQLSQQSSMEFKVVLVPNGFNIDPRMIETWMPISQISQENLFAEIEKAKSFKKVLEDMGISVIDLHLLLKDKPGTYLNFDGHWSEKGNRIVAERLASDISSSKALVK